MVQDSNRTLKHFKHYIRNREQNIHSYFFALKNKQICSLEQVRGGATKIVRADGQGTCKEKLRELAWGKGLIGT